MKRTAFLRWDMISGTTRAWFFVFKYTQVKIDLIIRSFIDYASCYRRFQSWRFLRLALHSSSRTCWRPWVFLISSTDEVRCISLFLISFLDMSDLYFLDANSSGTVYFFSPLYRKNLHYRVVPKPSKSSDVTKEMVDYILEHHPNDSGIVYCLSKKVSVFSFSRCSIYCRILL